jgi:hypothetical protein
VAAAGIDHQVCVSVPPRPPFPPGNACYRGGGFDDRYRSFFVTRRQYRVLATSFLESKADFFISRVPAQFPKVKWLVRIDSVKKCRHVNLVANRVLGLPDEQEYLSAFTVLSVE